MWKKSLEIITKEIIPRCNPYNLFIHTICCGLPFKGLVAGSQAIMGWDGFLSDTRGAIGVAIFYIVGWFFSCALPKDCQLIFLADPSVFKTIFTE